MTNETSLIILAGGESSRMSQLGKIIPKPVMTTFDEPLIMRHIKHARTSGIKRIIISTSPPYHDLVKKCLSSWGESGVTLVRNESHKDGSLPALLSVINLLKTRKLIMIFSDIFFLRNPFTEFLKATKNYSYVLGISPAFSKKELSLGGIIFLNSDRVIKEIREVPMKGNTKGTRWNGLAYFDSSQKKSLNKFLQLHPKTSPEGDFFEYLRKKEKIIFRACEGPDFINVNKPMDLFIATLYRYAEIDSRLNMRVVADKVRERYLSIL